MSIGRTVVVVELFDVGDVLEEDAGRGDRWNHFGRVDAAFVQAMAIVIIKSHTLILVSVTCGAPRGTNIFPRRISSVDLDGSGFKR